MKVSAWRKLFWLAAAAFACAAAGGVYAEGGEGENRKDEAEFGATLRFDFLYNGVKVGNVTETFEVDSEGGYVLESHAAAVGLAKLLYGDVWRRSRGRLDPEAGFVPEHYEEKRGPRPRQAAFFDRARGVIALSRGEGDKREEPLDGVVYDYLNALYLSYVLGAPLDGDITVTDGWGLRLYGYQNAGVETVRTPAGKFSAARITRTDGKKRIFWLAEELDYLPVRIYVDDKGHIFESILVGAEQR